MSARKPAPSSSPASSPSAAAAAARASSSSGSLSTRDAILQRSAAAESKQQSRAATAVGGKTMELFESGDGADEAFDNSHSTRSDRNLLLSSLGATGAGGAKKVGGAAAGAGVEDVDATTRVKPALAFQMFAGALYTGSGSVNGPSGGRDGSFETGPSSLLIAGSSRSSGDDAQSIRLKFESPFVKLQRLQDELKEFHVELKEAAASAPKGAAAGGEAQQAIWSSLSGNVQQLQGQLDAMMQQPQVKQMMQSSGPDAVAANSSLLPQFDSLFDQYVAELTRNPAFQPFPAASSAAESATASASSSGELAVLPKLDERLNVLEKLLGTSAGAAGKQPTLPLLTFNSSQQGASTQPITTTNVLPAPDLLTALSSLHAQLVQLNPQRLEFVSRACKQILIEQESIALSAKQSKEESAGAASSPKTASSDKSAEGEAAVAKPYAAQVAHLYALTARWDTLALTLPTLIARLSSLHALHASSATLSSRVSSLERQSGAIDSALVAQKDGLQAVSKAAAENLAAIHANFKAMDERIKQLTKKMEQIK